MPTAFNDMNAHEAPPASLKKVFKDYQKITLDALDTDETIIDLRKHACRAQLRVHGELSAQHLSSTLTTFMGTDVVSEVKPILYHPKLPGLLILPDLLPDVVQKSLLSRLLHRDLSDSRHKTNVHSHYNVTYPSDRDPIVGDAGSLVTNDESFFSISPSSSIEFAPKDPMMHKPLSILKFMNKSLRWITLGGQYDWTRKQYPDEEVPEFPADINNLIGNLFSEMVPQAAIINVYSPGDTLSLHRDVSEQIDKGLVSVSIGCDCLFVIGMRDESDTIIVRLRSGDALYMSKQARFAWHGVPKIIPKTCPTALKDWPAEDLSDGANSRYEAWKGWLSTKRINLNVRQMHG